jgi:hypothetical protein
MVIEAVGTIISFPPIRRPTMKWARRIFDIWKATNFATLDGPSKDQMNIALNFLLGKGKLYKNKKAK